MLNFFMLSAILYFLYKCYTSGSITKKEAIKIIADTYKKGSQDTLKQIEAEYLLFKNQDPSFKYIDFETYLTFKYKEIDENVENIAKEYLAANKIA